MENQPPYQRRHHAIDLTLIAVASILVIFTFAVITVYTSFLVACIACGSLGLIAIGIWRYPPHHKHHHEINMERRQQKLVEDAFQLTKELTLQHHFSSSLKLADGREWHWDSPWCVPDGPLTIKDNQFGLPQIAGAAPLPGPMRLVDVLSRRRFSGLYLGTAKGERHIECTLGGFLHAAQDAPTGQGKTNQWKNEIIQLRAHKVFVLLCNPNFIPVSRDGEDWRPIGQSIEEQGTVEIVPGVHLPGLLRDYATIVKLLRWLSEREIKRRFTLASRGDFSYPVIYLFVDEWPAIRRRYPEAAGYLVDILQRGRAVDVCCSVNAQGFLQGDVDLKGSARENFNTVFHMGGNAVSGSTLLDMPQKTYKDLLKNENVVLGKGIALLRNNESCPQAELVRLPLVDNDSVYYLLGRADDWTLPEFRTSSEKFATDEVPRTFSNFSPNSTNSDERLVQEMSSDEFGSSDSEFAEHDTPIDSELRFLNYVRRDLIGKKYNLSSALAGRTTG